MSNNKKSDINRNSYRHYNESTSAYNLEELRRKPVYKDDEIRESVLRKRKQRELEKEKKIARRKMMQKIQKANRINKINMISFVILSVYLIGSLIFTLKQFDNNNMIKTQIAKSQSTIKEQEKEISKVQMDIASSIDLDEVKKVAMQDYGMKEPSSDQIVYITLPQNVSYIEYQDANDDTKENGHSADLENSLNDIEKEMTIENSETNSESKIADEEIVEDASTKTSDEDTTENTVENSEAN